MARISMELEDLHDRLTELEIKRDNFFSDDDSPNYNDSGYQDILEQISNTCDKMSEIQDDFDENPDVLDSSIFEVNESLERLEIDSDDFDFDEGLPYDKDVIMEDCN